MARAGVGLGLLGPLVSAGDSWQLARGSRRAWPRRRVSGPPFQVLLYHRVNDERQVVFPGVPTETFGAQMKLLAAHWNVLPLHSLLEAARRGDTPKRAAAITFDDGYRDNYDCALPVLRRLGLPATIFLATSPLESGELLWHDRVFDAFESARDPVPFHGAVLPVASTAQRRQSVLTVLDHLRTLTPENRDREITSLVSGMGLPSATPSRRMMTWEEARSMQDAGIEFGAHTVSHPILSRMPHEDAVDEIRRSKETIEARLARPVKLFAFPNGRRHDYTPALLDALPRMGFTGALTTEWGLNDRSTPPFEWRRVGAWGNDPALSAARLAWQRIAE